MSNIINAELLFVIGPISIYELKTPTTIFGSKSTFFWRYKEQMDIHGPFNSIMEATRNWEELTRKPELPANVIQVDFRTKKRIK